MALSSRHRRLALQQLGRDRLAELTAQHGLEVADRRGADSHVDALVAARKLDFAAILGTLKRDELQSICTALGLDRGGREKEHLSVSDIVAPGR